MKNPSRNQMAAHLSNLVAQVTNAACARGIPITIALW
jgi:hypothetical protein